MNTKQLGDIGVAMAIAYYTKQGLSVLVPLGDNLRYDLVVDENSKLLKVQVKSTTYVRNGKFEVNLKTCGGNQSWNKIQKKISEKETDLVFVYCGDGTQYELPALLVAGKGTLRLTSLYNEYKI